MQAFLFAFCYPIGNMALEIEQMNTKEIRSVLNKVNAVITDDHFVYTSGKHGSAYVNKDALYRHTRETHDLCLEIKRRVSDTGKMGVTGGGSLPYIPQAVVAPAIGGVILSQWVAFHFSHYFDGELMDIPALYAERSERSLIKSAGNWGFGIICHHAKDQLKTLGTEVSTNTGAIFSGQLERGEELVIKETKFILKRGQDKVIQDLNATEVLVVEDILNTGGSAKRTVEAVRIAGGDVKVVAALCNRGNVTAKALGVEQLISLLDVQMDAWDENDCPICKDKGYKSVRTDLGHGKSFLQKINDQANAQSI